MSEFSAVRPPSERRGMRSHLSRRRFLAAVTGSGLSSLGLFGGQGTAHPSLGRPSGRSPGGAEGRPENARAVQMLIDEARRGGRRLCSVPEDLIPYDPAEVTFHPSIRMVREATPHSWYDVRAYGASGDGEGDDQPAIQAAVIAAEATGDGPVWLPAGTYNFESAVAISTPAGLELFGDGVGVTRLQKTRDRADCLVIEKTARDVVIRDLHIDGDWETSHHGAGIRADFAGEGGDHNIRLFRMWITHWHRRPLHFTGVNNIDIIQMKVRDLRDAVFFEQCADARIVDLTVIGAIDGGDNVKIRGGSTLYFVAPDFNYASKGNNLTVEDVDGRPGESLSFVGGRITDDARKVALPRHNPPQVVGSDLYADVDAAYELSDGASEPDVAAGNVFKTRNSNPTNLVDFRGGVAGQRITVIFGDDLTSVDFRRSELDGGRSSVWEPNRGDWMEAIYDGDVWRCNPCRQAGP